MCIVYKHFLGRKILLSICNSKHCYTFTTSLDLPVLSPDPEIANLYTSKSGTKRIFLSAKVDIPPSEFDIYSLPQVRKSKFFCYTMLNF